MFTNKSKVQPYSYFVDLTTAVNFFCKIITDIGSNTVNGFNVGNLFNSDFLVTIGYRYDPENSTVDELAAVVSGYYEKVFFDEIDLTNLNILFIYKSKNILFCYESDVKIIRGEIIAQLRKKDIFKKLLVEVNDSSLRASLQKLQSLSLQELFTNIFSIKDKREILVPYLPFSYIDETLVEVDFLDIEDIRVNKTRFKKELEIEDGVEDTISLIKVNSKDNGTITIGVKYNGFLFLISTIDLLPFIKGNLIEEYYWLLFKKVFTVLNDRSKTPDFENELLLNFKKKSKTLRMSQMLSFLQKNHFISDEHIRKHPEFSEYFEQVSLIKNLLGVKDFDFYISSTKGKTALGIYATKKVGDEFNLLHWARGNENNDTLDYFRNEKPPQTLDPNKTYVLKPELAFYILTKYFEDFFEHALTSTKKEYIRNGELYVDGKPLGEFDFLVKSNNKFCFIETKTKLTDLYIEEYILKCEKVLSQLNEMNINIKVEFYIFASFSDHSCENKRYFINESKRKGYNTRRVGFDMIPYHFKVPIPKFQKSVLNCIAEPEFTKLKAILRKV
jgi:hypothetical protein